MQKQSWRIITLPTLALFAAMTIIASCKKDEETAKVTVTSIKSETKELAGATAADKVSRTADIVVTFSKAINAVNASDFTLTATGGTAAALTATLSGNVVTLNPTADLLSGTNYTLAISGIRATDGGLFDPFSITFKTDGLAFVVPPQASRQIAYFDFNNNVNSSVGSWNVNNVGSSYATDRGGFANSSVEFNGTTDIIEVDNGGALFAGPSSTLSFWVWADTTSGHGLFAMGINGFKGSQVEIDGKCNWFKNAASFTTAANDELAEDIFFNGEGAFNGNGGWQGWNFNTDLRPTGGVKAAIAMKWAHVAYTYDAATKLRTVYLNGVRVMQSDFNLWPDGDIKRNITGQKAFTAPAPEFTDKFAFGFAKDRSAGLWSNEPWGDYNNPNANHFKGRLDDVRFFNVALTAAEISTLYNAEK